MMSDLGFPVEPWSLRETELRADRLAQTESIFALANGHIGWRGNLDEGEPHGMPGSYLNGVYENWPIAWPERGYGYPEAGETMINVTNGKLIRLLVDDEPFDVRYGKLRKHERVLDFRAGTLRRDVEWTTPAGVTVQITSERLVSLSERAVAAIRYEVRPLDAPARVVVQSELVANEQLPYLTGDPRLPEQIANPLHYEESTAQQGRAILIHRTRSSGLRVAVAMDHVIESPSDVREITESTHDTARLTVGNPLQPGQSLRLVKFVAFGWSSVRSRPALRDQVEGALTLVTRFGWQALLHEQRAYLDDFWSRADVALDGDDEIQQAARFALFHVLQAGARAEGQAIAAKGLTGTGYDGHAFWDTETYVMPVLTYTFPKPTAHALGWRHSTLGLAQDRARELGLAGAAFPWRTIAGKESSGYWPASTAAFHINADIAAAVVQYAAATGDEEFAAGIGLDLLVNTARLWRSLGHFDPAGKFRIDGVTGPDEYSALADNNVYTNLMAQQNLRAAAEAVRRYPDRWAGLGTGDEEAAAWLGAADAMTIPYDDKLDVHPQADGFTGHQDWDFAGTDPAKYPLLLYFSYFDLYRKQVVKQADLVMAMLMRPDAFTSEQKARNFAYYERLTVRDSSLSAPIQAVIAAEVGQPELAYDYLAEAALQDLEDLRKDTSNGMHIAALAGAWIALVQGLGGMRHRDGVLSFAPRLPAGLTRLAFCVTLRGRSLRVEASPDQATYQLADGDPMQIRHYGTDVTVEAAQPQKLPIPPLAVTPRPSQPPGREPARREQRRSLRDPMGHDPLTSGESHDRAG